MASSALFPPLARRSSSRRGRETLLLHNDLFLLWDCCVGFLLGYATDVAYMQVIWFGASEAGPPPPALLHEMVLCSVVAALMLREPRLATDQRMLALSRLLAVLSQRGGCVICVLLVAGAATRALDDMARLWITGWWLSFAAWVMASRLLFVATGRRMQARGQLREVLAVIGGGGAASEVAARLGEEADVVSVVECSNVPVEEGQPGAAIEQLMSAAREGQLDTIVIAKTQGCLDVSRLLACLKSLPVQVAVVAELAGLAGDTAEFRKLAGVSLAVVVDTPRRFWEVLVKTLLDRLGALLLLLLLAPLLLVLAALVVLDSPGPAIYRQRRQGWGGRPFTIYKFRSMRHQLGESTQQTLRNDARITRIGRVLRSFSLDELPQLWNVLIGDMSLVGPRPHVDALHAGERAGYTLVSEYARRQRVKPGLTGWAQINGWRGATIDSEHLRRRIEFDLHYIDNWSIWLDFQILALTPFRVLGQENAF